MKCITKKLNLSLLVIIKILLLLEILNKCVIDDEGFLLYDN